MSMQDYLNKLKAAKADYPFQRWGESGLDQYTPEVCAAFTRIFDKLIADLGKLGVNADDEAKLAAFEQAVLALNDLDDEDDRLIETEEREQLCALVNTIGAAAGLDPTEYGGGAGLAEEWREW
jgi:hypothetical protein